MARASGSGSVARLSRRARPAAPRPLDLVLDQQGLWTTAAGTGGGVLRSMPVPGGMAPVRVWPIPVDARLGPALADLLDPAPPAPSAQPTLRAAALGRLVAAAIRAGDEGALPVPRGGSWRWRPAPGPEGGRTLEAAVAACGVAGVVLDADPEPRLRQFVDDVVDARLRAALELSGVDAAGLDTSGLDAAGLDASGLDAAGLDASGLDAAGLDTSGLDAAGLDSSDVLVDPGRGGAGVVGATLWADHVIARAAANARTALVLSPPEPGSPPRAGTGPAAPANPGLPPSPGNRLSLDSLPIPNSPPSPGSPPSPSGSPRWALAPLAIRIDEPTTRLPLASADPAMFGASPQAWAGWAATEAVMLRRAWGTRALDQEAELLAGGSAVALSDGDVLTFVDRIAPRLQEAGFDVVAPGGLLRPAPVRRRMKSAGTGTGALKVEGLGLQAEVLVDGETLTEQEFASLAASKSELVSVRGRWMRIGPRDAQRLAALARRLHRPVTPADLLSDEAFEGTELEAAQILPAGLRPARAMPLPEGVRATLRPYQRAGVDWLTWLADNGIGGILADDMGLGKTLQVLTSIQADHEGPTLVVCPVTLVDTWARQSAQFTPDLRVRAFHGAARGSIADVAADADILVTTYGLLARDESLAKVGWHRVVLDEAQAIKNPDTRAARAARALTAAHRLVVTGTPVENHLGDLWSLMAFAQPGLLPRRKQFASQYSGGDPAEMARLRAVVGPFLLRRVKTDPGILPDLPDRQVIRADCTLTREQLGAYEAVVADMMGALEELRAAAAARGTDGPKRGADARTGAGPELMGRRAAVLGGISRLKQICVHPALLTESRRSLGDRSGKVTRLVDLCAQIVDEGQAVVVFTQFASFVPDLADHLRASLGVPVATLTGSDSRAARAATVASFGDPDGPPVLIASLKAGGTGLTLVRANHVIHLDRWWNPAVEDQASDRVWRIGQHQKVSVHVLVCPGTLEERIDQALAAKRTLAASVVRSTEAAITELSDADLTSLVGLVRERVLE